LIKEQTQNISNNRILCAINILLENKSEAESNFDQLMEEKKCLSISNIYLGKTIQHVLKATGD
jgi:hypothetical protein